MTILRNLLSQNDTIWTYYSLTDILPASESPLNSVALLSLPVSSLTSSTSAVAISFSFELTFWLAYRTLSFIMTFPISPFCFPHSHLPALQLLNYTISMCFGLIYLHCFFYYCWITVEDINDSSSVPHILGLDHQDLPLIFLFETFPRVTEYGWESHWHLQLMSLYVCNSQTLLGLDFEETRAGDSCHLPVTSIPVSVTEVSLGTHLCITCLSWGFITNTLFYITTALSNTWLMDCDT